jgi:3-oxoacyl-[acyl-carrier protein] reductase
VPTKALSADRFHSIAKALADPRRYEILKQISENKGAVDVITRVLSKELGPKKIRVNSINPGMVETEGAHTGGFIGSDFQKQLEAQTPLGRIAEPDDIAPIAVFLASADSAWLTGETLLASGGVR